MKIRFISYGHKFYEAEGKAPPYHDFLFNLRDLSNPFWVPELKPFNGLQEPIRAFFAKDETIQNRLTEITELAFNFIKDFSKNESRTDEDSLTFAFKCTGGKHRSTYFAQSSFEAIKALIANDSTLQEKLELEVEHVDLERYLTNR
ncbi:MAG: hypothetical protein HOA17_06500 [Candidatus Melainabacteria bacterium]|jgi:RNase adapter protein RapZ|nr:hypothetical protein [Candidatus Melainabacteria bacterium]